ncbi:MAG: exonuclease domain-containing protein [Acidimicrobiales bacterium]
MARSAGSGFAQLRLFDPLAGESIDSDTLPPWTNGEFLAFDLETTGVDRFGDLPVSFAFVRFSMGSVVERQGDLVDPGRAIPEAATALHGITTEMVRGTGEPLEQAVKTIVSSLFRASSRKVPVVGVKLDYDLTMVDVLARRISGLGLRESGWDGPVLDALVLDRELDRYRKGRRTLTALCDEYDVNIANAHSASADAEAAGRVLLAMAARYPDLAAKSPVRLHLAQMSYHRDWLTSYSAWRSNSGLVALPPSEWEWPIATTGRQQEGAA